MLRRVDKGMGLRMMGDYMAYWHEVYTRVCGCIAPPKCNNLRLILCVGVGLSKLQFTM